MPQLFLKAVLMLSSSAALAAGDLKSVMQNPLIVGASVSGDFLAPSPGKRLALRYTKLDQIKVVAAKGKPGREVLKGVSTATLKDRSVVIGMDLFFWDSFAHDPAAGLKAVDHIVDLASARGIPLVLGDIPALMPAMQKSLEPLNRRIRESCARYAGCHVLKLNDLLHSTIERGYITQDGKRYTLDQLLPDGLHLATPASDFLADEIAKLL